MQASSGSLINQVNTSDNGITSKSVTVGPITTSRTWNTPVSSSGYQSFPKADMLAKQYTSVTGSVRNMR